MDKNDVIDIYKKFYLKLVNLAFDKIVYTIYFIKNINIYIILKYQ